jgi:hypothetical protein
MLLRGTGSSMRAAPRTPTPDLLPPPPPPAPATQAALSKDQQAEARDINRSLLTLGKVRSTFMNIQRHSLLACCVRGACVCCGVLQTELPFPLCLPSRPPARLLLATHTHTHATHT